MLMTKNPRKTRELGKPKDWDEARDGACHVLEIEDQVLGNGLPAMISLWTPTKDELDALIKGGSVRLHVYGTAHPPVWVDVEPAPCVRNDRGLQS
jgi:hypothetical protein